MDLFTYVGLEKDLEIWIKVIKMKMFSKSEADTSSEFGKSSFYPAHSEKDRNNWEAYLRKP